MEQIIELGQTLLCPHDIIFSVHLFVNVIHIHTYIYHREFPTSQEILYQMLQTLFAAFFNSTSDSADQCPAQGQLD